MSWLPASPLWRWSLIGAAALAVVAALAGGGWAWYSVQESRARTAFADAAELVRQAQVQGAAPEARARATAALEAVLTTHARASIAPQVAYQLGNLRYAAGEHARARGAYEVALGRGASGTLKVLSALGVAYAWEAEKNYGKAQAAYEAALIGRTPKDFLYEELLMDLARVQEFCGNPAAAVETYQRLLKELPDSRRGADIRSRIASLESARK